MFEIDQFKDIDINCCEIVKTTYNIRNLMQNRREMFLINKKLVDDFQISIVKCRFQHVIVKIINELIEIEVFNRFLVHDLTEVT